MPVFYLVAPQVWAWRQGRVKIIRRWWTSCFALFPFEEPWFRQRGVDATYIGHPLASIVENQRATRAEFLGAARTSRPTRVWSSCCREAGPAKRPVIWGLCWMLVALLRQPILRFPWCWQLPKALPRRGVFASFRERIEALSIKVIENEAWDCIGHADLALAASGTVTMEAAVLGTPMVTFYKVTAL